MSEKEKYCVEFKVEYAHLNPNYTSEWIKHTETLDSEKLYLVIDWNTSDEKPRYQVSKESMTKQEIKEVIMDLMKQYYEFQKQMNK